MKQDETKPTAHATMLYTSNSSEPTMFVTDESGKTTVRRPAAKPKPTHPADSDQLYALDGILEDMADYMEAVKEDLMEIEAGITDSIATAARIREIVTEGTRADGTLLLDAERTIELRRLVDIRD